MIEFENKICSSTQVYIYGAGEYGKTVASYLLHMNLLNSVKSFLVTNKENGGNIFGKPIVSWNNIRQNLSGDELIIIAVAEESQNEILRLLSNSRVYNTLKITEKIFKRLKEELDGFCKATSYFNEISSGMNLDRIISESNWLKSKNFSTGGMAVGNQYLYKLYRILDSQKFKNLLDIGLGQTSKMMSQYAAYGEGVSHIVVEADRDWIEFFLNSNEMKCSRIEHMNYKIKDIEGIQVRTFVDFEKRLSGKKFDYISIDAPLGSRLYSRIDILDLLPECLEKSWIIMMDDVSREGEQRTLMEIENILKNHDIKYAESIYSGAEKAFAIITSYDNRFYCTI